jgi:hypothetical protein
MIMITKDYTADSKAMQQEVVALPVAGSSEVPSTFLKQLLVAAGTAAGWVMPASKTLPV